VTSAAAGFYRYLVKPADLDELQELIAIGVPKPSRQSLKSRLEKKP
jgi:hypothetical protein